MKLSNLLSDVLDGQKLVDNAPDKPKEVKSVKEEKLSTKKLKTEAKKSEESTEQTKPKTKVKKTATPAAVPTLPELQPPPVVAPETTKQKHDEEIAAMIKAQIKKPVKPTEPPAKTMSVPDFAKIREMTKLSKKTTPPQEAVVEKASTKTDASKT